jgi:hypothetical protein
MEILPRRDGCFLLILLTFRPSRFSTEPVDKTVENGVEKSLSRRIHSILLSMVTFRSPVRHKETVRRSTTGLFPKQQERQRGGAA